MLIGRFIYCRKHLRKKKTAESQTSSPAIGVNAGKGTGNGRQLVEYFYRSR